MATIPRQTKISGASIPQNISEEERSTGLYRSVPRQHAGLNDLINAVPAFAIEATDIVSSSVGLTERDELSQAATADFPGLRNFLVENRGALEATTGLAGILVSQIPATKLTKTGSFANKLLGKVPGVNRLSNLDRRVLQAKAKVRLADRQLAEKGISGKDAFNEVVELGGKRLTRKQVANKARRTAALRGGVQGAAAEGFIYATQNENDFLYSEEPATNLALAGLGIAAPAFLEVITTNAQIRKFLTDDKFNRVASRAIDRGGFEELLDTNLAVKGKAGEISKAGNGAETDGATLHFLAADAKGAESAQQVGQQLFQRRNTAALLDLERGTRMVDRVTRQGIPGAEGSAFKVGKGSSEPRIAQHLRVATKIDPTALYGTEFIGKIPEGKAAEDVVRGFNAETERLGKQADELLKQEDELLQAQGNELAAQVRFRESLEPIVFRNLEAVPVSDASGHADAFRGEIIREDVAGASVWRVDKTSLSIDRRGQISLPKNKTINGLTLKQTQGLYAAADKAIDSIVGSTSQVDVRQGASWFELDVAEEIIRRSEGKGVSAKVNFPQGLNRETAILESLSQKIDVIKKAGLDAGESLTLRERLNLPRLTSFERGLSGTDKTGLDQLIDGLSDGTQIKNFSLQEIGKTLAQFRKAAELVEHSASDIDLLGNSFKLGKDLQGNPIESFITYRRPTGPAFFSRTHFEERLANRQADVFASLTGADGAGTFVGRETERLVQSADFQEAIATSKLSDISTQGTLPFRGNVEAQTSILPFDFAFRDHPVLLAAQRIQDNISRETRKFFDDLLTVPQTTVKGNRSASDVFATLRNRSNNVSSQYLNQFISARRGWDIADEVIKLEDGLVGFGLKNTDKNKRRWKEFFGEDLPKGATLRHQSGEAVVVDDLALDGLKSFQGLAARIRTENNALLKARGKAAISQVEWYVPPRNFDSQFVQFVVDANNNAVQTVAAHSKGDLNRLIQKLGQDPNGLLAKDGYRLVNQTETKLFNSLWERAYTGLNDPTIPVVQSGARSKGSAQSAFIEFNAWEEGLQSFQRQFNRLGNDIIELNFRNQLDAATARASGFRSGAAPNRAFNIGTKQDRNIHDFYAQALLGRNPINNPGSIVGSIYRPLEAFGDSVLSTVDEFLATSQFNVTKSGVKQAKKDYNEFVKRMEGHFPFEDINDFLEQKFASRVPSTVRNVTGRLNSVTASLTLRWAETAHSILNVTGLVNTSPAVINYFTPRAGENTAQYAKRVGHSATVFNTADGPIGVMDMGKVMNRAFQRAWNKKGEVDFDFMQQRGYLNQEVAEFHRELSNMGKSDSTWSRFWDKADKTLGILSDKSEEFSRSYAHMVGLEIAENVVGITSRDAKHTFAHDVANKVIANYNPQNRPEIFQSGIGAPLGLFQSYMMNYYQRLFRYVETGDKRSFAIQTAMQGGLFGAATVPGWREFNNTIVATSGGETSAIDGIYNRFGTETGDLITAGTLSNLPKLFGADGVALYTRGDTAARLPGVEPFPVQTVAKNFFAGMSKGIDFFREEHPGVTGQEIVETLGQMLPNRPLSGLIDVFLGEDVDRRGNVIATEVNRGMSAVYRLAGLKPLRDAKVQEALFANRRENELKLAQRTRLLRAGRSAVRSGNPEAIPKLAEKYLETGGDPAYLRTWLREVILSATTPKSERELQKIIGNADKLNQMNRLIDARILE